MRDAQVLGHFPLECVVLRSQIVVATLKGPKDGLAHVVIDMVEALAECVVEGSRRHLHPSESTRSRGRRWNAVANLPR